MSGYFPFEVLKDLNVSKVKCPHKWTKKEGKYVCEICTATGFYSKEKDKVFMKKNAANFKASVIDSETFNENFKEN